MPMNDGDRHAATNVERRESFAVAPDATAPWKCEVRIWLACAARGSDGGIASNSATKSATAVSGCVLDHFLAFGCAALGAASITSAATAAHTFSRPDR